MFAHRLRAHQRFDISWDNCETFLGVKNVSIVTGIMAEDEGFYHLSSATLDTRSPVQRIVTAFGGRNDSGLTVKITLLHRFKSESEKSGSSNTKRMNKSVFTVCVFYYFYFVPFIFFIVRINRLI